MLSNSPVLNFPAFQQKTSSDPEKLPKFPNDSLLASYASHAVFSRGRLIAEPDCSSRTPFARDRDRIIHSNAFRRLNYKTQVFVYHEGDHFRTRLTHSLEVAQISRSLGRLLHLDEELCEAIALAHDIGHTPFGHAGERALSEAFKGFGGFDHNIQTLRVLTNLEKRYAKFDGLNLSWETLEGLIKHNGPLIDKHGVLLGDEDRTDLPEILRWYELKFGFGLHQQAGPEGQVAAVADDIAYNNHDIDDGLRAGLFSIDDLASVPFAFELVEDIRVQNPGIEDSRLVFELNRRLITLMICDVQRETAKRLDLLDPQHSDDIRGASQPVVAFSAGFEVKLETLKDFLYKTVYRNKRVMSIMNDAEKVTKDLVAYFMNRPEELPEQWRCNVNSANINECAEHIKDFIAGMTDRYIIELHRSLFDVTPKLR